MSDELKLEDYGMVKLVTLAQLDKYFISIQRVREALNKLGCECPGAPVNQTCDVCSVKEELGL